MSNCYLLVGLGKTGLSVARFLFRHNKSFVAFDTREAIANIDEIAREFPGAPVFLGSAKGIDWKSIHTVVASPGVSLDEAVIVEAKKQGLPVIGDIELFSQHNKKPAVAITGTNGKSTVTQMVGEIIAAGGYRVAICGNIGQPVLDVVDGDFDVYVLELSSFQLEITTSLVLEVACILNISPDHLDRHKTLENYLACKHRIFQQAKKAVVNLEDKQTVSAKHTDDSLSFGLSERADFYINDNQLMFQHHPFLATSALKIVGTHNMLNALAASAMAYAFSVSLETITEALKNFKGLAHRCEWVTERAGVTWINDSKGTNIGATIAALQGLGDANKKNIIWIAGGQGKGADFSELSEFVSRYVKKSVLLGEDKQKIQQALPSTVDSLLVSQLADAINEAEKMASSGDVVLFSPACASFDMFENFVKRGEAFTKMVLAR